MYKLHRDFDLTDFTTFRVPAMCEVFVEWDATADLAEVIASEDLPRPFLFMGGGSNMLFTRKFSGTVFRRVNQPTLDSVCCARCEAGEWGFENLSGIPGSIYGAVVQNAGAYGTEMKDVVDSVEVYDIVDQCFRTLSHEDLRFSYRYSMFKDPGSEGRYAICMVNFKTPESVGPNLGHGALRSAFEGRQSVITPMDVRRAVMALRDSKLPDPSIIGSAGSFFRNPELLRDDFEVFSSQNPDAPHFDQPDGRVKVPAAWLIDQAGLKGTRIGGAQVWPGQPLVIVNSDGSATAADVVALEDHVKRVVMEKFNVNLIPEVQHI